MSRRERYLEALGVDLWQPRVVAPPRVDVPAPAMAPAPAEPAPAEPAPAEPGAAEPAPVEPGAAEAAPAAPPGAWEVLRAEVASCTRCELARTRTQTVFGVGDPRAPLLVIGEAPGADEDRLGEPFVGRAGQLLDSMLRAMGNPRESVYIANVLKCRPPGNRDPKPEEVACCLPYLQRQVDLIRPALILAVGRIAAQNLLATDTPIGRLRGQVHHFGSAATPLIVTYHPAYLLRSPGDKRKAWTDLKLVRAQLARHRAGAPGA